MAESRGGRCIGSIGILQPTAHAAGAAARGTRACGRGAHHDAEAGAGPDVRLDALRGRGGAEAHHDGVRVDLRPHVRAEQVPRVAHQRARPAPPARAPQLPVPVRLPARHAVRKRRGAQEDREVIEAARPRHVAAARSGEAPEAGGEGPAAVRRMHAQDVSGEDGRLVTAQVGGVGDADGGRGAVLEAVNVDVRMGEACR